MNAAFGHRNHIPIMQAFSECAPTRTWWEIPHSEKPNLAGSLKVRCVPGPSFDNS
jgi:hypothetical protein